MIRVTTNIKPVLEGLGARLSGLANPDQMLRTIATSMVAVVRDRVHVQGIAQDGSAIGSYSEGYMAVRTGRFKTNDEYKSGPRKGQPKNTGKFTKGPQKGQSRPNYNRTNDRKVVASLTRQMENDLSVQATESGNYGIGYNNPLNAQKAIWVEATYRKKIFALTADEKRLTLRIAEDFLKGGVL